VDNFKRSVVTCAAAIAIAIGILTVSGTAVAAAASKAIPKASSVNPNVNSTEPAGYTIAVSTTFFDNPTGEQTLGYVECPSGTVVFSGGVSVDGEIGQNINSSWPLNSTEWEAWVNNTSGLDAGFYVYAVCADEPSNYSIAESSLFAAEPYDLASEPQACPKKTVVLGGGAYSDSSATDVNLNDSYPTTGAKKASEWEATMDNDNSTDSGLYVYAVCAKKPKKYSVRVGSATDNPSDSTTFVKSTACAKGVIIGGGLISDSILGVDINETAPDGTKWESFENNASGDDNSITPYGICAV